MEKWPFRLGLEIFRTSCHTRKQESHQRYWADFPLDKFLTETLWMDKKSNNCGLKHINCFKIHDCIILNNNSGDDNETSQWSPLEDAVEPAYSEGKESSIHLSRLSWITK